MSGIFPQTPDGGLPPNPASPLNPSHAYTPQFRGPLNTSALYYGNGCDVRLRPEVVNSLISELEAIVDRGLVSYDQSKLTNAELAIRYLIQRGEPSAADATGGPNYYYTSLTPPLTHYNDGLVILIRPLASNGGAAFLSVSGLPHVQVLRNDGVALSANDWIANVPQLVAYWGGAFWTLGLSRSHIPVVQNLPKVMTADFDAWVNPATGNDSTGDGTPSYPFRTIQGGWSRVGGMFIPSPFYGINFRLQIPGDYEGPFIANFGGLVRIIGNELAPASYRIKSMSSGQPFSTQTIWFRQVSAEIIGISVANTGLPPNTVHGLIVENSAYCMARNCIFRNDEATGMTFWVRSGGTLMFSNHNQFLGNNQVSGSAFLISNGGVVSHLGGLVHHTLWFQDWNCTIGTLWLTDLANFAPGTDMITYSNCHGPRWNVTSNSILSTYGNPIPGDVAGTTSSGGQVV